MAFRWPVDNVRITGTFGADPAYYAKFGQKGHNGIDIGIPVKTPVYASESGTILFEGWGQNHSWMGSIAGISVIIDHGSVYTGYAHLSSTVINKGQSVSKGQLIGYSGATGTATGPHLHFEFIGKPANFNNGFAGRVDPNPYLNQANKASEEQIKQAYREILEREADQNGLNHYKNYSIETVRTDLANSQEKRLLDASKAEASRIAAQKAAEEAARQLAEAEKAKEIKAAQEAAAKAEAERLAAEAEAARIAEEERVAREAAEKKAKEQEALSKQKKEKLIMATQEKIAEQTSSVVSANEFTPIISEKVKTVAYFATDATAIVSGLVFTLLAIFGVLDAIISVTVNAAITTALLGIKQTFRLTSKKQ